MEFPSIVSPPFQPFSFRCRDMARTKNNSSSLSPKRSSRGSRGSGECVTQISQAWVHLAESLKERSKKESQK